MTKITISIPIPDLIIRLGLWILLRYKKIRYGCEFRYILLNHGRYVIVDSADYEKLIKHNWFVTLFAEYAVRIEKGKTIYMHNEIMQPQAGLIIDHKDHNGLNNSRANLRPATKAQNCWNRRKKPGCSSRYKGVCFNKAMGKWAVSIRFEGRRIHRGYFVNEEEAARAYDEAARKYHGEFAALNFK